MHCNYCTAAKEVIANIINAYLLPLILSLHSNIAILPFKQMEYPTANFT